MGKVVFSKEMYELTMKDIGDCEWPNLVDGCAVLENGFLDLSAGRGYKTHPDWTIELAEDYGPEYVWPDGYMRIFSEQKFREYKNGEHGFRWPEGCDGHAVINGVIVGTIYGCSTSDDSGSYNVDNWCLKIPCCKLRTGVQQKLSLRRKLHQWYLIHRSLTSLLQSCVTGLNAIHMIAQKVVALMLVVEIAVNAPTKRLVNSTRF